MNIMRGQVEVEKTPSSKVKGFYRLITTIKLFDEVFNIQKRRIYNALVNSSSKEVINFNNILNKIINEKI